MTSASMSGSCGLSAVAVVAVAAGVDALLAVLVEDPHPLAGKATHRASITTSA
jgi:hypothetical protein